MMQTLSSTPCQMIISCTSPQSCLQSAEVRLTHHIQKIRPHRCWWWINYCFCTQSEISFNALLVDCWVFFSDVGPLCQAALVQYDFAALELKLNTGSMKRRACQYNSKKMPIFVIVCLYWHAYGTTWVSVWVSVWVSARWAITFLWIASWLIFWYTPSCHHV